MIRASMDNQTAAVVNRASDAVSALASAFDRVAAAIEAHTALLDGAANGPRG